MTFQKQCIIWRVPVQSNLKSLDYVFHSIIFIGSVVSHLFVFLLSSKYITIQTFVSQLLSFGHGNNLVF